jgi:hypothetical protein
MPTACTLFKQIASETFLFKVPQYSKWSRMLAGTALNFDPFFVEGLGYRLNVYPAGFDEESADYIAVFVSAHKNFKYVPEGTCRILFEFLDDAGERAVFSNSSAGSGQETFVDYVNSRGSRGYVRFVKRSEMEASSCVRRDDSFVIRCTVSKHEEVYKRPAEMFKAEAALSFPEPASREEPRFFRPRSPGRFDYF